jgi:DNA ligase (NAD+)
MKELIETLNSELKNYQHAYYAGNPLVSDAEYDQKEQQLISLIKSNPQYSNIATVLYTVGTKDSSGRIPHTRPMKSIENHYTKESAVDEARTYGKIVLVEQKRDGISNEITYVDGDLIQSVTRGDGAAGEDQTLQTKACKLIPQHINSPVHILKVRGEMVMRKDELERINALQEAKGLPAYANTRNLVAGTLKNKDTRIISERNIFLMPWDVYSPNEDDTLPDSAYERMLLLESLGFPKYQGFIAHNINEIEPLIDRVLKFNETDSIQNDGVVIKTDSHKLRNVLGVKTKFTNFQCCYKNQHISAETTILGIEWGVGRQGKVTPVLLIDPIDLGGAITSRATGNNVTWMNALGIQNGSVVSVCRSGEVIPMVTEVIDNSHATPFDIPEVCPACGNKLEVNCDNGITILFCRNSLCEGKAAETFYYIADRATLEIDNLGIEMAKELIEHHITSLSDLFEFANVSINAPATYFKNTLQFRSGANVVKMVKSIQDAKTRDWDKWFAAFGIPMVGHTLGKVIATKLNLQSEDMQDLCEKILTIQDGQIDGLGVVKLQSLRTWANDEKNVALCIALYHDGVRPQPLTNKEKTMDGKLNDITFCITGTFKETFGSRTVITGQLEALGAKSVSSVTKACNLLIAGDKVGSKLSKAEKLGIKIVGEEWLSSALD